VHGSAGGHVRGPRVGVGIRPIGAADPRFPVTGALRLVFALAAAALLHAPTPIAAQGEQSRPLTKLDIERTERMLERRVACLGCHVIGGRGGRIGPALDGISTRADLNYVASVIRDPQGALPGTTMPRQAIPQHDVARLASYLMLQTAAVGDDGVRPQAPPPLDPGDRLDGSALYARHCAACHGTGGGGDGWNAATLPVTPTAHADAALMGRRPDDTLYDAIYVGGYVLDKSARMPAFGDLLEPEQIRALVAYIRELCDCTQPAWASGQ
jgi:mono/diheme cytochrome c family protein